MNNLYFSFLKPLLRTLLLLLLTFNSQDLLADGSKDLYPAGALGYRAKLRAYQVKNNAYPYANDGFHYVYAKVGERITLASSGQGIVNRYGRLDARIKLFDPLGVEVINNNTTGVIANRQAELAGPALPSGAVGSQYIPIYHQVTVAGIYRVEFTAPDTLETLAYVNANENFIQGNNVNVLFAWDVSVVNNTGTAFVPGRVYANVMTMSTGGNVNNPGYPLNAPAFYGVFYALTKDGYTYKVNNNGNQGFGFTFFVNNNGVLDSATQQPTYKSLRGIDAATNATKIHDPNNADTPTQITHKLFYRLPADDLPSTLTNGAVPGGQTWLKTSLVIPSASGLSIEGVEGTPQQLSKKGGYIKFTSPVQANYKINIVGSGSSPFPMRTLAGTAAAGENKVYFDGKDGNGQPLPVGSITSTVQIQLQGAEVHFPYIDMEYNTQGVIIERLGGSNLSTVISDLVYWNDEDIPDATNPAAGGPFRNRSQPKINTHLGATANTGISSNTNGHIWGQGATSVANQFGDNNVMDTWTFVQGPVVSEALSFTMAQADLKISNVQLSPATAAVGDIVTLKITAKNEGPSDVTGAKITWNFPLNTFPQSFTWDANSCTSSSIISSVSSLGRNFVAIASLKSGCEVTYNQSFIMTNELAAGVKNITASILRPNDITDPDATNPDPLVLPTNAQYECSNNGAGGICNNIVSVNLTLQTPFAACDNTMFLTQYPPVGGTSLYTLNNVTNPLTITQVGPTTPGTVRLNGVGYNPIDNYIYGINSVDNHLYRVDANFAPADLGVVTNLGPGEFISGDIDHLGNFYVKANTGTLGGTSLYRIDVNTKVATQILLNQQVRLADFAYNKVDGFLYGVGVATERLYKIDPATGVVTASPQTTGFGGAFGAMYTDGITGAVYGNSNTNNNFYRFNTATGVATLISNSISSQGNDGAHCVNAAISFGADLAITKTDGKFTYIPGTTNVYTAVVTNLGPFTATDAVVQDLVPAGIPVGNVSYSAVASVGSTTSAVGTQTGDLNDIVDVQPNGTISYTITLMVPGTYTGDLTNTATVIVSENNIDPDLSNNIASDTDTFGACYDDPAPGVGADSNHGITLLQRAGADNGNWPMIRKGAFTVLESNTKGFVITRMTSDPSQTMAANYIGNITQPQDGMMIYDTFAKCLKIYTVEMIPSNSGWKCYQTPACP